MQTFRFDYAFIYDSRRVIAKTSLGINYNIKNDCLEYSTCSIEDIVYYWENGEEIVDMDAVKINEYFETHEIKMFWIEANEEFHKMPGE